MEDVQVASLYRWSMTDCFAYVVMFYKYSALV